jgi:hypothetical protein
MLSMVAAVCSSIVSPSTLPSGPIGPVPVTNTRHPWE